MKMKLSSRTAILAVAALVVSIWNLHRSESSHVKHGLPVLLVHACSWQDSFNDLGDERQVIMTKTPEGVDINQTRFDEAGLQKAFSLIYSTRSKRLAWFRGDAAIRYGDAMRVVSDMYQSGFHPAIALLTTYDDYVANSSTAGRCIFAR